MEMRHNIEELLMMHNGYYRSAIVQPTRALSTLIAFLAFFLTSCGDGNGIPPQLMSLEVDEASGSMFPDFDAKTGHYGVRCDSSDIMQVTAVANSLTHELYVDGRIRGLGIATFEVVNPEDGRDIVIEVSQGSSAKSYTLHCIPLDVPNIDISVSTSDVSDGLLF